MASIMWRVLFCLSMAVICAARPGLRGHQHEDYPLQCSKIITDVVTTTFTVTVTNTMSTITSVPTAIPNNATCSLSFTIDPEIHHFKTQLVHDPHLGGSYNLSYWVTHDGLAVTDGDIIWGPESALLKWSTSPPKGGAKRGFGAVASLAWPDATLPWKYDSIDTAQRHGKAMEVAIKLWLAWAPYLKFEKRAISMDRSSKVITVISDDRYVSHSTVGWRPQQEDNERVINFKPSNDNKLLWNHYLHEWGHQLGLEHEHQRPDRDDHITFVCKNVDFSKCPSNVNCCAVPEPDHDCCRSSLQPFAKYEMDDPRMRIYGKYDFDSIMHYPAFANGIPNAIPGLSSAYTLQYAWAHKYLVGPLAVAYDTFFDMGPPMPFSISRGDALAVCELYTEACRKCWPKGVPDEPGVPCDGELPVPEPGPSPDFEVFVTPPPPIPTPAKPSKLTSGWTLVIGDLFWINGKADKQNFITVDGVTSINTKCLPMTISANNFPEDGQLAPKGWALTFETRIPAQSPEEPDTCCLRMFTLSGCDYSQGWSQLCGPVGTQENGDSALTPMDIRSFQVYNCTGVWTDPLAL